MDDYKKNIFDTRFKDDYGHVAKLCHNDGNCKYKASVLKINDLFYPICHRVGNCIYASLKNDLPDYFEIGALERWYGADDKFE